MTVGPGFIPRLVELTLQSAPVYSTEEGHQ